MLKRTLLSQITLVFFATLQPIYSIANNVNIHGSAGVAVTDFANTQYLNLGTVTDKFISSNATKTSGVWGYGLGYQWDKTLWSKPFLIGLDFTGYYTQFKLSGVQTPAINLISGADALNYSASESNLAWMFEPRLISTMYSWQPYIMGGIGLSINKMNGYNEYPSNYQSSAIATNAFGNNTTTDFAWELGVGIQHVLYKSSSNKALMVAAEYRYMDWGQITLGPTAAQTTQQYFNFKHLQTNIFDLRLSYNFI